MTSSLFSGFIAAPFTSMHTDGSIHLNPIKTYASYLKAQNISGAFILGTTGEGVSLTLDERKEVATEWMKFSSPEFKIIVHVGSSNLKDSRDLAQHAQEIGADAVGISGTSFFKPSKASDMVKFVQQIAASCSETPVYYYHIPSMSGVNTSVPEFLEKADGLIPNLTGVKFTHHDLMEMNECMMALGGKYEVLHGFDETLICGLAIGAKAAVGSTYNYFAPVYQTLREAFLTCDMDTARDMQRQSVRLVQILKKYGGGIVCGKAIMNLIGIDCGPCRSPLATLSKAEMLQLSKDLEAIDFFSLSNTQPINMEV
ncbi:MAG: dihydrodipicolinate synthase family protein [Saprospiraceae bacterium]|nr:dihydrodipicolinate synthase family protein [Saprospiraceae bacterium]